MTRHLLNLMIAGAVTVAGFAQAAEPTAPTPPQGHTKSESAPWSILGLKNLINTNLVGDPNVEGACVAWNAAGQPRIDLYVTQKHADYKSADIPADVEQNRIVLRRPIVALGAKMGSSTSAVHGCGTAGTLGVVVHDRANPKIFGYITCNHVAASDRGCPTGQEIDQAAPGCAEQHICPAAVGTEIGRLIRSSDIATGNQPYKADAAFIRAYEGAVDPENDCGLCALSTEVVKPLTALGAFVMKCGRQQSLSCAQVTGIGCTINVQYCKQCEFFQFVDQIRVEGPFSSPGDSGSVVYTTDGGVIGLLFSGDGRNLTFVNPMQTVLDELQVDLEPVATCLEPKCEPKEKLPQGKVVDPCSDD